MNPGVDIGGRCLACGAYVSSSGGCGHSYTLVPQVTVLPGVILVGPGYNTVVHPVTYVRPR